MLFTETKLSGSYLIDIEPRKDARGFFARSFCGDEFRQHGLIAVFTQINVAESAKPGTLRGLHFQSPPHAEAKVVCCTAGAIFDVIVDLRPDSATRGQWFGVELTAQNHRMIYVPPGFAQGYQTQTADAAIYYLTSAPFAPGSASGVRYNDPAFGITWPAPVTAISDADTSWPAFRL